MYEKRKRKLTIFPDTAPHVLLKKKKKKSYCFYAMISLFLVDIQSCYTYWRLLILGRFFKCARYSHVLVNPFFVLKWLMIVCNF